MNTLFKMLFLVVIVIGLATHLPACGGGGGEPAGDSGDNDGGAGGGDNGGDVTPVTIDANKAVDIASNASTVYALKVLGFDLELGDLGLASMSVSKAIPLSSLNCSTGVEETITCEEGGEVLVAWDCHSVEADNCGVLVDGTMTFNDCSPKAGLVISGDMTISPLIVTALGCDFETAELEMNLTSDNLTITGDVSMLIDALEFTATLTSGTLNVTINSGVLRIDDTAINCEGNPEGGISCDPSVELSEVSFCDSEDLQCEDGAAGDAYCFDLQLGALNICDEGCCESYPGTEFTCIRGRECPQGANNNFFGVYSAVHQSGGDSIPYPVPLTCVNSVWQIPCLSNAACRKGALCNVDYVSNEDWITNYESLFPNHGFCECAVYSTQSVEAGCGEGKPDLCCSDGIDNDDNGYIDCDDASCKPALVCSGGGEQICDDGIDNDDDGKVDCDDSQCFGPPDCDTELNCSDEQDNDKDGDHDCCDADCEFDLNCAGFVKESSETLCDDGWDNDCDVASDCFDQDCLGNTACKTYCDGLCNPLDRCPFPIGCNPGEQCGCGAGYWCVQSSPACMCCDLAPPE